MADCLTCKHCKFDEVWGEYKCLAKQIRLYNFPDACKLHKKKVNNKQQG